MISLAATAQLSACGASRTTAGSSDAAPDTPSEALDETDGGEAALADAALEASSDAAGDPDAGAPDAGATDVGDDGDADAEPPPASGSPFRALSIATGIVHACAILDNHRIKCWGANLFGCLGTGSAASHGFSSADMGNALPFVDLGVGRTAKEIAAGRYVTSAILDDDSVKCWGWRDFTGLPKGGPGDDGQVGNAPGDLGDALPALALGTGRKAIHIASGYTSTCVVLDDGTARCWGRGAPITMASVGGSTPVRQLAPAQGRVMALFEDGRLSGLLPTLVTSLVLPVGRKATFIGGSDFAACAVLDDGGLACTAGTDKFPPAGTTNLAGIDVAAHHTCTLSKLGEVRCYGTTCGDYPVGTKYWCPSPRAADRGFTVALGQPAKALGTGAVDFSCALLEDGSVKCWSLYDTCIDAAGDSAPCGVPASTPTIVGASVEITGTGADRKFGAWRSIDFGTHP